MEPVQNVYFLSLSLAGYLERDTESLAFIAEYQRPPEGVLNWPIFDGSVTDSVHKLGFPSAAAQEKNESHD